MYFYKLLKKTLKECISFAQTEKNVLSFDSSMSRETQQNKYINRSGQRNKTLA